MGLSILAWRNRAGHMQVFRGYDKTLTAEQDANQQGSSAEVSVPPQQQPSQAPPHEQSMPQGTAQDSSRQPLPGPPAIQNPLPAPMHGAGPPSLPGPPHMLGGAMPAHPMMQQLPPHMQESQALSHLPHMHSRPGMLGSQHMPRQNGFSGHMAHGQFEAQNGHMHADKRQRGEQREDVPHMHHPPGDVPRFSPHIQLQRRDSPAPPLLPHMQLPPHDPPQHAHARPAGPPKLPPHLQLHASFQHPLSSSSDAAGYNDAHQSLPHLPPHLAASMSQQQQQQHAQPPYELQQQQHYVRSAVAETREQASPQPDMSSSAPQQNGKRRHSRRQRGRERRQREREHQQLNGRGKSEKTDNEWSYQHDSAAASHSVPGVTEVRSNQSSHTLHDLQSYRTL